MEQPASPSAIIRPVACVGCVVWRAGRVLLIRRAVEPGLGTWSIPGGRHEPGERAADGAAREVLEETGVHAEIAGLIDIVDLIRRDEGGRVLSHFVVSEFSARWRAGDGVPSAEASDVVWADPGNLDVFGLRTQLTSVIAASAALVQD